MHEEQQYLQLMQDILDNGDERLDRTGTGTLTKFGINMRFDLSKQFPLLTTKRVWWKGIVHELLWFLSGSTNIKYLIDNGVHIWDEWADENGELGPVYGKQWRQWEKPGRDAYSYIIKDNRAESLELLVESVDQIKEVVASIKNNPYSRRHIISAWNVAEISRMALPPCHLLVQFDVSSDKKLSCSLYQRSGDFFLGVPFNIASYALLTHMLAHVCDLEVGDFIHNIGNAHLYLNHLDQAKLQLAREPYELPQLKIKRTVNSIFDFKYEDFEIVNYRCHPAIKADIAV